MPSGWWKTYFCRHPQAATKAPNTFAGTGKTHDKPRLFCSACLVHFTAVEQAKDRNTHPPRQTPRSEKDIIEYLFDLDQNDVDRKWIADRTHSLLHHLRSCTRIPESVRDKADQESIKRSQGQAAQNSSFHTLGPQQTHPIWPFSGLSHPTLSNTNLDIAPSLSRTPSSSQLYFLQTSTTRNSESLSDSFYSTPSPHPSQSSSLAPSDSISQVIYHSQPPSRVPSRTAHRRTSRQSLYDQQPQQTPATHAIHQTIITEWSQTKQLHFERCIVRLTASAGLPLSWVDNPEFIQFCKFFLPFALVPSRETLTSRLIPREVESIRATIYEEVTGKYATAQADGWTGINNRHYIGFMATISNKVYTVKVADVSSERKTADNLYIHMLEIIETLKTKWRVIMVGFTTDASGEARKARSMLVRDYPDLVCPDCYAHQINLIVGDYFKVDNDLTTYSKSATELITWLRSKTYILALLRDAQSHIPISNRLSVIRPVLTRWTAHYLAFRRLLELQRALQNMVNKDEMLPSNARCLVTGDRKSKATSRKMIQVIKDPLFWYALARIKTHLELLARAANIAQAAMCRLDQILLTFGSLFIEYTKLITLSPGSSNIHRDANMTSCEAILASLEKRWAKADQDVFIAAVVLNPFIKIAPFRSDSGIQSVVGVWTLLQRLYKRLLLTPSDGSAPRELYQNVYDYLHNKGIFVNMRPLIEVIEEKAAAEKQSPNPLEVYEGMRCLGAHSDEPPLIKLAQRILSICANSASCERLFSTFGNILTKLRSRLGRESLTNLAELKMHIRDQYLHDPEAKPRLKRHFGWERPAVANDTSSNVESGPPGQPSQGSTSVEPLERAQGEQEDAADSDMSLDPEPAFVSELPSGTGPDNRFLQMVRSFADMVDQDVDQDPLPAADLSQNEPITLKALFDPATTHWVKVHERSASRSFDEELELYELTALDAEGDLDLDLDETIDTIFST